MMKTKNVKRKTKVLIYSNGVQSENEKFLNNECEFVIVSSNTDDKTLNMNRYILLDKPDIIVSDIIKDNFDILLLLDYINGIKGYAPMIIATGQSVGNIMIDILVTGGCSYYLNYPITEEKLLAAIRMLRKIEVAYNQRRIPMSKSIISEYDDCDNTITASEQDIQKILTLKIDYLLSELGIPYNILGRKYITDSIIYIMSHASGNLSNIPMCKELYPEIAKLNATTSSRAERAIRHAIECSFKRGNMEKLDELFGYTVKFEKDKPTNGEFIATICTKLKNDMNIDQYM